MKASDVKLILTIMSTADGGCSHCVSNLYEQFVLAFPQYLNEVLEMWEHAHPSYGMHSSDILKFKAAHKKVI